MDRRSILIDYEKKDIGACSFGMPWDHDAICYNFDFPTECVLASEIDTLINDKSITGIVIGHDLEDYSFLKSLSELNYLYFYNTKELTDLIKVKEPFLMWESLLTAYLCRNLV